MLSIYKECFTDAYIDDVYSCRDNTILKQAVIGWHEHAINESGYIQLNSENWNETFSVPVRAVIDGKADGDITGASFTLKLKAGIFTKQSIKIPVSINII